MPSLSNASPNLQESVKDVMEVINQASDVETSTSQKAEQLFASEI